MDGAFTDKIHKLDVRVYYEDTDFSGVVYHANFLKFAERGRSSFLRLAGVKHSDLLMHEPPLAFVVRGMNIEFVAPARIDDVLVVESQATSVPLHRQLPSVGSCMCSLEESLSVLSSTEEFHSAIETPPNAPDTFERNAETSRCHAPKRYRAISQLARQSSGD